MTLNTSRRSLLKAIAGLAGTRAIPHRGMPLVTQLAGLAALAAQSSQAADLAGSYKALVCLYMTGGSDSHNWVVPVDATGFAEYSAARGDLAWPAARLQQITATTQAAGRAFAMPVELAPLRKWYESGQAAVVANVGPLVRPTTRADYSAGTGLPSKLFSHNDQASTWLSLAPEGARSGWGGRMGDILASANAYPVFTAVSTSTNAVFLSGTNVTQYQVSMDGPLTTSTLDAAGVFGSNTATGALRRSFAGASGDPLQAEYNRVVQRALANASVLKSAFGSTTVPAIPATPLTLAGATTTTLDKVALARQLRVVLQMIAANQALGMRRQVFMVSMGGFDTHGFQMRDQPGHMAQVSQSLNYFLGSLSLLGLLDKVTVFTASDFGRTLLSNGDGSDHGWGSHHFVAGGAVRGQTIHGRFPITATGTSDDVGSGRLLPSTSVTELAASLGGWMGLSSTEQALVLPNLANFSNRLSLFW